MDVEEEGEGGGDKVDRSTASAGSARAASDRAGWVVDAVRFNTPRVPIFVLRDLNGE